LALLRRPVDGPDRQKRKFSGYFRLIAIPEIVLTLTAIACPPEAQRGRTTPLLRYVCP
jgi:hypothetical protein